jgi:prepilin-type N-terminal cleavage/methylation domain-containing protein
MNHHEPVSGLYTRGFTLIELLIVVAIIAILAAIAVPNFLEAQTRSKVSRLLADMRSTVTAIEAYRVDYNAAINPWWPSDPKPEGTHMNGAFMRLEGATAGTLNRWALDHQNVGAQLTSPIEYMSSVPEDLFWTTFLQGLLPDDSVTYGELATIDVRSSSWLYWGTNNRQAQWAFNIPQVGVFNVDYTLQSLGPDLQISQGSFTNSNVYDPTNGTVSPGDIFYFGPYGFTGGVRDAWNIGSYRTPSP